MIIWWLSVLILARATGLENGQLDTDYTGSVVRDKSSVYVFDLNSTSVKEYVIRVHVLNELPQKDYPLLVVIKQRHHITSFEVPVVVDQIIAYTNVSRTLCPITVVPNEPTTFMVELSSFAPIPVTYGFKAEWVRTFDLKFDEQRDLQLLPAQPVLLRYQFKVDLESVAVKIVSPDDVCLTFSVQPLGCPIHDSGDQARDKGPYQTVTNLGVISTNRLQYWDGFFVVLILEATDYLCMGIERLIPIPDIARTRIEPNRRAKNVTLTLVPTPNRWFYLFPIFGAIGFFLLFYVAAIIILCVYDHYERKKQLMAIGDPTRLASGSRDYGTMPVNRTVHGSPHTYHAYRSRSLSPNDDRLITVCSYAPPHHGDTIRSWHSDETDRCLPIGAPGANTQSEHNSPHSECALSVPPAHTGKSPSGSPGPETQSPVDEEPARPVDEQEAAFVGAVESHPDEHPADPHVRHSRAVQRAGASRRALANRTPPSNADDESTVALLYGSRAPATDATSRNVTMPTLIFKLDSPSTGQFRGPVKLADLSRKPYATLNRKYLLYFWFLIIISIFYGLPAVQLIMIYQKTLVETGNEDLCYYNFECARPLGIFTAFNNIISNVGYVMLGLLFLALTARRDLIHRRAIKLQPQQSQMHGIPQHYGLYYSMGMALTMEGIMSACYHMCPSFSNFQFDTAYMYILAMLIMLKIYQTRHPDVNATAHSAYMVMAVIIFLGVAGVVYGSETFWIAFTIFFLLMSVVLTAEIYYMGQWNIDLCLPRRLYSLIQVDGIHCLRPMYLERMILLLIANLVNFALAGYGVVARPRNFSSFLLMIFMINMMVYTMFYIIMKLRSRERFLPLPVVFMAFAIVSWSVSIYFFSRRITSWEETPAQSRSLNQPCLLLSFYDAHDIWHFTSAISMFFSFLMLMNMDDDLANRPRDQIPVF